jgi:hypothetical protein
MVRIFKLHTHLTLLYSLINYGHVKFLSEGKERQGQANQTRYQVPVISQQGKNIWCRTYTYITQSACFIILSNEHT